ncbi:shikimate dehydrogenase family protein [Bifidobacterium sp.]|uniref:shikimate dehydrogenase family protein n=1 Tax=Bifidobacterium sp. TaxID=41200 RepID=UPI0025B9CF23|nr:shikimate dehydrogenase [Bifidobacterium sp.]MCI1635773.1 shikimate dehydrogenase [Bifidobacterium sp.]
MQTYKHRCAVLGKPIAHSLSPVLHMAAYQRLGLLQWQYERCEVGVDNLEQFLDSLDSQWAGLSLTMPLKKAVMSLGKPSDTWSSKLGVANTAILDWSMSPQSPTISLYNTDVQGIATALKHHSCNQQCADSKNPAVLAPVKNDIQNFHTALLLGNGSTATSALAACIELGIEDVLICARHPEKSTALLDLAAQFDIACAVKPLTEAATNTSGKDVVISTLPAHAADAFAEQLLECSKGIHGGVFLDVVYDPRPTAAMSAWRTLGAQAIGGEMMLLYQAIPQVALMTKLGEQGLPADIDAAMLQALQEVL